MNIAIVGCGKIADSHVEEIRKISCARLVAVCDLEPIIAEQLAVRYEIPRWYTDFDRMLSEQNVDVLHIATPPHSHLSITQKAVGAGCHVFLEKPLAINATDARLLIDCVQEAGRKMTINYWPNFETPALELKRFVANGDLGDPVHVESFYGYDLGGRFGQAVLADQNHWVHKLPGKLFHNIIDHAISKVMPFLDNEKLSVLARAYSRLSTPNDIVDFLPGELRVMILGGSTSAYVTFCSHARPLSHFLRIYGTRNTVHLDFALRTMLVEQRQSVPTALGRLLPPFKSSWNVLGQAIRNVGEFAGSRYHYFAGMNHLLSSFYDSILKDTSIPIPYAEILRVSQVMDEIFAQIYPGV
jgi:predicted dehydrogenase